MGTDRHSVKRILYLAAAAWSVVLAGCAGSQIRTTPAASTEIGGTLSWQPGVAQKDAGFGAFVTVSIVNLAIVCKVPLNLDVQAGENCGVLSVGSRFITASLPKDAQLEINNQKSGIRLASVGGGLQENTILPPGRYTLAVNDALVGGRGGLIPIVRSSLVANVGANGVTTFPRNTVGLLPSPGESFEGSFIQCTFSPAAEGMKAVLTIVHSSGSVTQTRFVSGGTVLFKDFEDTQTPVDQISLLSLVIG